MAEMPELVELQKTWKSEGVRVQTVSIDIATGNGPDTAEGIAEFARKKDITIPIVAYAGGIEELAEKYGMSGAIPFTFALNASGEIVDTQVGGASKERFDEMVKKALGR